MKHIIVGVQAVVVSGHACMFYVYIYVCQLCFTINIQLFRMVYILPTMWRSANSTKALGLLLNKGISPLSFQRN